MRPSLRSCRPSTRPSCPSRLLRRRQPVRAIFLVPLDSCAPPKRLAFLSRDLQISSLGIFQRSPLRRICLVSPVPDSHPERWFTFGQVLPNTRHLPPLSFFPTPTVCSSRRRAGLLHPATSHGVRAVSCPASSTQSLDCAPSSWPSPDSPFIPFEAFPSPIAVLRHRSRCLLVVGWVPSTLAFHTEVLPTLASSLCAASHNRCCHRSCSAAHPARNLEALLHL